MIVVMKSNNMDAEKKCRFKIIKKPIGKKIIKDVKNQPKEVTTWELIRTWKEYGINEWMSEKICEFSQNASFGNLAIRYFSTRNPSVYEWEYLFDKYKRYSSLRNKIVEMEKEY